MKKKLVASVASIAAVLSLGVALAPSASASWSANSGTTLHNPAWMEAWAWTSVQGGTSGRSYAQVGSNRSDTGWRRNTTSSAHAYGRPWDHPVRHDYYVR